MLFQYELHVPFPIASRAGKIPLSPYKPAIENKLHFQKKVNTN